MEYEVIIVGGGHAGCEAALVCARKKHKTLLITSNIKNVATLSCNPSIGGSAKGIVVREIDALGGAMGKIADKTHFQIKKLNTAKGPAVRSLRSQVDNVNYPKEMLLMLKNQPNLTLKEAMVEDLMIENKTIKGVVLSDGNQISTTIVILTTGTYLKSEILIGSTRTSSGPSNEETSLHLSDNLKKLGFKILRLKTGTPPRIKKDTIDFSVMKKETGDEQLLTFNFDTPALYNPLDQEPCYLTYTNQTTHNIIMSNLEKSSMYGGLCDIKSIGPRYCPSIEDKIVRFKEKERHQLFLEPESKFLDHFYLQGFSTSMPHDIQLKMVRSLNGLEKAEILKYAYAIEYDCISPTQLKHTLETKIIKNLYTAGQINGTSGYEEAAGQGLMAGINASLKIEGKAPLILKRNEAYIGVLIDDLVTKGTTEPYRLLTSRAEYRLLLRHDNADLRLREYGYKTRIINQNQLKKLRTKQKNIEELTNELKNVRVKEYQNKTAYEILKMPDINYFDVSKYIRTKYDLEVIEQVIISIKYEGYIKKTHTEVEKMIKNERKKIPMDIDYKNIPNLASEARQKLTEIRPISLGQAIRISGINPSDITTLSIYIKRYYENE